MIPYPPKGKFEDGGEEYDVTAEYGKLGKLGEVFEKYEIISLCRDIETG